MVYSGKPSTGCQTCRKRHIKCDETKPHCRACTKTGRSCPGYRHPFDVVLRDQTSTFLAPVPTTSPNECSESSLSWHSASFPASRASTGSSVSLVRAKLSASSWPPSISPSDLYQPMEETVLPLFFNSYLYLPKDPHVRNGFMEFLPMVYSDVKTNSHLHDSTMAVAFFSVAAWTGQTTLLRASQRYFTRALPKLRDALASDVSDREYNLILISILLLSAYEEFIAIKDWKQPPKAHLKGAVALINSKRKAQGFKTPLTFPLYHAVQTQIIKTTRGTMSPMVPRPEIWPLAQTNATPSPRNFLSTATTALVELRQAWDNVNMNDPDKSEVRSILNQATKVDVGLFSWTYCLPPHWLPVPATIIPQSVRDASLYRNRCDCYNDLWIGATWNTYRDCRMLVQSIMLKCLRLLPSEDPDGARFTGAQKTIQSLADDVCASVPYFMGNQMESVRLVPDLVQYPYAEERPITSTHKMSAPLMGPWHLFAFLRNLHTSNFNLPPEQLSWVEMQMNRILTIYFQR